MFKKESGQAIVLIAGIFLLILAMIGLALDGGALFVLHQRLQNAVDAAAMAAAYDFCLQRPWSEVEASARSLAEAHGFSGSTVAVMNPVLDPRLTDPYKAVRVTITVPHQTYFIRIITAFEVISMGSQFTITCVPPNQLVRHGYD